MDSYNMSGHTVTICLDVQLQYVWMDSYNMSEWTVKKKKSRWTITICLDGQSQYVWMDSHNMSGWTVTICPELVLDTHQSSVWCDICPQTLEYFALSMCVIFGLAHNTGNRCIPVQSICTEMRAHMVLSCKHMTARFHIYIGPDK